MRAQQQVARVVLAVAGAVIVALTAGAFWLSYAHLHAVAADNGLSSERAWAWPGCLDLFIVSGELLMLHGAFRQKGRDWWAIGLTAVGSLGSIALNVWGVQDTAHATLLSYTVAAVPPSAALLAFGALMRQVHDLFAVPGEQPAAAVPVPVHTAVDAPVFSEQPKVSTPRQVDMPTPELPQAAPVDTPLSTPEHTRPEVVESEPFRFSAEVARKAIVHGWTTGMSVRDTAQASTRSPSYVQKVFTELDAENGPRPAAGQLSIVRSTT